VWFSGTTNLLVWLLCTILSSLIACSYKVWLSESETKYSGNNFLMQFYRSNFHSSLTSDDFNGLGKLWTLESFGPFFELEHDLIAQFRPIFAFSTLYVLNSITQKAFRSKHPEHSLSWKVQGISERTEQQKITLFENDQITKQPVTILSYSYWSKLHDDSRKSGALRNGLR
jgi:hypothetical protein